MPLSSDLWSLSHLYHISMCNTRESKRLWYSSVPHIRNTYLRNTSPDLQNNKKKVRNRLRSEKRYLKTWEVSPVPDSPLFLWLISSYSWPRWLTINNLILWDTDRMIFTCIITLLQICTEQYTAGDYCFH